MRLWHQQDDRHNEESIPRERADVLACDALHPTFEMNERNLADLRAQIAGVPGPR